MSIDRKKYLLATLLILFLIFPFLSGTSFNSAFALSGKVNPVGTNLIVEIAKKQNPAVVFVESKTKFQPAKCNSPQQHRGPFGQFNPFGGSTPFPQPPTPGNGSGTSGKR